jgi:hypothetical protein
MYIYVVNTFFRFLFVLTFPYTFVHPGKQTRLAICYYLDNSKL